MRIDYSEPKQSYVASQSKSRPRKEPLGLITTLVILAGVISFLGGFGTGWFFSQKAAKKSFQAATEQASLENSPKSPPVSPVPSRSVPQQPQAMPQAVAAPQQTAPASGATPAASGVSPEPPLSFYKTLPSGQIDNVLGSGINAKDEKTKQPLQAAIPANLSRQLQPAGNSAKPSVEKRPVAEKTLPGVRPPSADKPQASDKTAAKSADGGGFVVQVASYSNKSEAETLKSKLSAKGYNASIVSSNQGDKGIWYRVRVGRQLDWDAARELAEKLGKGSMVIPGRE